MFRTVFFFSPDFGVCAAELWEDVSQRWNRGHKAIKAAAEGSEEQFQSPALYREDRSTRNKHITARVYTQIKTLKCFYTKMKMYIQILSTNKKYKEVGTNLKNHHKILRRLKLN